MKIRTKIISRWQRLKDKDSWVLTAIVLIVIAVAGMIWATIHGIINIPNIIE